VKKLEYLERANRDVFEEVLQNDEEIFQNDQDEIDNKDLDEIDNKEVELENDNEMIIRIDNEETIGSVFDIPQDEPKEELKAPLLVSIADFPEMPSFMTSISNIAPKSEAPFNLHIMGIDDEYFFESPFQITQSQNKHKRQISPITDQRNTNTPEKENEDINEPKKVEEKKIMSILDKRQIEHDKKEKIDKIKAEKKAAEISELTISFEQQKKLIKRSLKGFMLAYTKLYNHIGVRNRMMGQREREEFVMKKLNSFVVPVFRNEFYSVQMLKELFWNIKDDEEFLPIIDQYSVLSEKSLGMARNYHQEQSLLFCEFLAFICIIGHKIYKYKYCSSDNSCTADCLRIVIEKFRDQGFKRGFPIPKSTLKTESNSKAEANIIWEMERNTKRTITPVGKKVDAVLRQTMSKLEIPKLKAENKIVYTESDILSNKLRETSIAFLIDSKLDTFDPKFCSNSLRLEFTKCLIDLYSEIGLLKSLLQMKGSYIINLLKETITVAFSIAEKLIKIGKFDRNKNFKNGQNLRLEINKIISKSQLKTPLKTKEMEITEDDEFLENIFSELIKTQAKVIEEKFELEEIQPGLFRKEDAEYLHANHGKLFGFGHYLLCIIITMKCCIVGADLKARFLSLFLSSKIPKLEETISKFKDCYDFINQTNYDVLYKSILKRWESSLSQSLNSFGELELKPLYKYCKENLLGYDRHIPFRLLCSIYKCCLIFWYNNNFDQGLQVTSVSFGVGKTGREHLMYMLAWGVYAGFGECSDKQKLYQKMSMFVDAVVIRG